MMITHNDSSSVVKSRTLPYCDHKSLENLLVVTSTYSSGKLVVMYDYKSFQESLGS